MSLPVTKTLPSMVICWLRSNLFRNPFDAALSILLIAAIISGMYQLLQWGMLNSVWAASSFDECTAIVAQTHGVGTQGACWAPLLAHWDVIMFGFYPTGEVWRPVMAFCLFPLALLPVMFRAIPRIFLIFSATYPVLAFYLIWGGAGLTVVPSSRLSGVLLTMVVAVAGSMVAVSLGVVLAIGRCYAIMPLSAVCTSVTFFFRSIPVIVVLFAGTVLRSYALPAGTWVDPILWVSLLIAMPTSALIATELHSALRNLPTAQKDAARALGLTEAKVFFLVTFPQAYRSRSPAIVGALAGLFRNTTLMIVFGQLDLLQITLMIPKEAEWRGSTSEIVVSLVLLYWVFGFAFSRYSQFLSAKRAAERTIADHAQFTVPLR